MEATKIQMNDAISIAKFLLEDMVLKHGYPMSVMSGKGIKFLHFAVMVMDYHQDL